MVIMLAITIVVSDVSICASFYDHVESTVAMNVRNNSNSVHMLCASFIVIYVQDNLFISNYLQTPF
jgi:hypothetical protein